jgi:hypothetical protein
MQELPALSDIWNFCRENPEHLVWYVHSKGVTHAGAEMRGRIADWRRLLLHAVLDSWPLCVVALEVRLVAQHPSAFVSIRQHTSAYVSIRQHTSAYVSIRQHTRLVAQPHLIQGLC